MVAGPEDEDVHMALAAMRQRAHEAERARDKFQGKVAQLRQQVSAVQQQLANATKVNHRQEQQLLGYEACVQKLERKLELANSRPVLLEATKQQLLSAHAAHLQALQGLLHQQAGSTCL